MFYARTTDYMHTHQPADARDQAREWALELRRKLVGTHSTAASDDRCWRPHASNFGRGCRHCLLCKLSTKGPPVIPGSSDGISGAVTLRCFTTAAAAGRLPYNPQHLG